MDRSVRVTRVPRTRKTIYTKNRISCSSRRNDSLPSISKSVDVHSYGNQSMIRSVKSNSPTTIPHSQYQGTAPNDNIRIGNTNQNHNVYDHHQYSKDNKKRKCSRRCVWTFIIWIVFLVSVLIGIILVAVLIKSKETDTLPIYGVQLNFDPQLLPNGWSLCYSDTYSVFLSLNVLSTIFSRCNKGKLMLGCRPVGSSLLTVAAMGFRADVFYNCGSIYNCTHVMNGVGWYYSDVFSWGFVNNTDEVYRYFCDGGATSNPAYRLCWHTNQTFGGYRCGSNLNLNNSTSYERNIYHAN